MRNIIDKQTLDKLRREPGAGVVIWYGDWDDDGANWHNTFCQILRRFQSPIHSLVISYPAKRRCIIERDGRCVFDGSPRDAHEFALDRRSKIKPVPISAKYIEGLRDRPPLKVVSANPNTGREDLFHFESMIPMNAVV